MYFSPFYCRVLLSTHMVTNVKLGSPVLAKLLWCRHRVAGSDLLTSHPLRLCFVERLVLRAFWTKWQLPCLQTHQCVPQLSGLHSALEQRRLFTVYAMPSLSKFALWEFQMILAAFISATTAFFGQACSAGFADVSVAFRTALVAAALYW